MLNPMSPGEIPFNLLNTDDKAVLTFSRAQYEIHVRALKFYADYVRQNLGPSSGLSALSIIPPTEVDQELARIQYVTGYYPD